MSKKIARPKVRVTAQNIPLSLPGFRAQVEAAKVDIEAKKVSDDAVDLSDRSPKVRIRSARVAIDAAELDYLARSNAKKAKVDLHVSLSGTDGFEAAGATVLGATAERLDFKAAGHFAANRGKLAFVPKVVDVKAKGAQAHVDLPARLANISAPSHLLLQGLQGPAGKGQAAAIANPKLKMVAKQTFAFTATIKAGGRSVPLSTSVQVQPTAAGKLGLRIGAVQVELPDTPATVDLDTRTADVQVPAKLVTEALQKHAGPFNALSLRQEGPHQGRLEALVPSSRFGQPVSGWLGPRLDVSAHFQLAAGHQRVQVTSHDLVASGRGYSLAANLSSSEAAVRASNAKVIAVVNSLKLPFRIEHLTWLGPREFAAQALAGDTQLAARGRVAITSQGHLGLSLDSVTASAGGTEIPLEIAAKGAAITATLTSAALTKLAGPGLPQGLRLEPCGDGQLVCKGNLRLWGLPVPVETSGQLSAVGDNRVAYQLSSARVCGIDLLSVLQAGGMTVGSLLRGNWKGNTLTTEAAVPNGMQLKKLAVQEGQVQVGLSLPGQRIDRNPPSFLPEGSGGPAGLGRQGPAGGRTGKSNEPASDDPRVRFDGKRLDLDLAAYTPFASRLLSVEGKGNQLALKLTLDPTKLTRLLPTPHGLQFDGRTLTVDPAALAGQKLPGVLQDVTMGKAGFGARLELDRSLLAGLDHLPPGLERIPGGLEVDLKRLCQLPGQVTSATATKAGLDLELKLSKQQLQSFWTGKVSGLAWDGQTLTLDPTRLVPGGAPRATGAVARNGALVVTVSDGTALPPPSAQRVLQIQGPGPITQDGIKVEEPDIAVRPQSEAGPWDLDHVQSGRIEVNSGKVVIPAKTLEGFVKQALGPSDYAKYRPVYQDHSLVVHAGALGAQLPISYGFERGPGDTLLVKPLGFFKGAPPSAWGERALSTILSPLSGLLPGGSRPIAVDLAKQSKASLPQLTGVSAEDDGLVLRFGKR